MNSAKHMYLAFTVGLFAAMLSTVFLTVGGLHVFYDSVIWTLRRPSVAEGFALVSQSG